MICSKRRGPQERAGGGGEQSRGGCRGGTAAAEREGQDGAISGAHTWALPHGFLSATDALDEFLPQARLPEARAGVPVLANQLRQRCQFRDVYVLADVRRAGARTGPYFQPDSRVRDRKEEKEKTMKCYICVMM